MIGLEMSTNYVVVSPPADRDAVRSADAAFDDDGALSADVLAALSSPGIRSAVHLLLHGLASGRSVRVMLSPERDYSPQEAADALGISRKLVSRLIEDGDVASYTLPGSRHAKVPSSEIDRLLNERARMEAGIDNVVDALIDGGAEY